MLCVSSKVIVEKIRLLLLCMFHFCINKISYFYMFCQSKNKNTNKNIFITHEWESLESQRELLFASLFRKNMLLGNLKIRNNSFKNMEYIQGRIQVPHSTRHVTKWPTC